MDISKIRTLLNWMQSIELGPGDLSTETVSPYALHSSGSVITLSDGIFAGREVLDILFEESGKQLSVNWKVDDGDRVKAKDILLNFSGNGAEILKNRRLIEWIIGRMSGIATATRDAADLCEQYSKELVQGITVDPIFELIDKLAFEIGGGTWKRHGLTDSIYLTKNHLQYSGGYEKVIERLNEDLGDSRRTLKIEIEVNSAEEFEKFNELDYDILHLLGLPEDDIKKVFEKLNPRKKPVLHLSKLQDFKEEFTDYFFKYCAVEELHKNFTFLPNQIIFNS